MVRKKKKPDKIPTGPIVNQTGAGFHRDRRKRRTEDKERCEIIENWPEPEER